MWSFLAYQGMAYFILILFSKKLKIFSYSNSNRFRFDLFGAKCLSDLKSLILSLQLMVDFLCFFCLGEVSSLLFSFNPYHTQSIFLQMNHRKFIWMYFQNTCRSRYNESFGPKFLGDLKSYGLKIFSYVLFIFE